MRMNFVQSDEDAAELCGVALILSAFRKKNNPNFVSKLGLLGGKERDF